MLHFRRHEIENLGIPTSIFDSDIRDNEKEPWLLINDSWFDLCLKNTTDVVFRPQAKEITATHDDNTYISIRYKKYAFQEFVDWADTFIVSKNFNAVDAGKTVEDTGAIDRDGNVPTVTIEGQFSAPNIEVKIKGHDLYTALSRGPGQKDECTWKHSRIVNSQHRQIIRWGDTKREIFSVG